ncbi:hypothetical protein JHK86_004120 [Glycine max]|nr:hypothetical protein JHK86_004120 [Glycine max]
MVNEALRHVPNTDGNKNIDVVNQIRDSLAIMGDNSTAFSLPQPHIQRTKLCDMKDVELDQLYVKRREQLKKLVASIITPKIVQGKTLNGKEFVSFLEQILEALNKGEIPSTGSLVEVFNKNILEKCLKLYSEKMAKLVLPLPEKSLQGAHDRSRDEVTKVFDQQHFGRHHAKKSFMQLDEEIQQVYKNVVLQNEYQSSRLCEALYTRCEDKMDQLQVLKLPSLAKFNAGFLQCNRSFERECVGPSKANYEQRIMKMMGKSRSLFIKEYNHRLFNWLVAFSLVMVVIGRFFIKFILVEIGAWALFIFLETYTRMFWTAESLYYNPVWHFIVATWETVVYSPILDLDRTSRRQWAMLGFSYGEIFLSLGATAALIGPKDLPIICRTAGRLAGRAIGCVQLARGQFDTVMQQSQARRVHKELQDTMAQLDAIHHEIRSVSIINAGPLTRRLVDNPDQTSISDAIIYMICFGIWIIE